MDPDRVIGKHIGVEKGPMIICFGGMHGNEPAGIKALDIMFKMLEVEPITNPDFRFCGQLLGIRGNLKAIKKGQRFLQKDLNRLWTNENVARIKKSNWEELDAEDQEVYEILQIIEQEIATYNPEKLIMLDLHTTTAFGGIFSIATDDPESLRIAIELHAPVVKGLLTGIRGTTLHYFNNDNFEPETIAVCFESGQHDEHLSVNRAIAAITNCMRTVGCVRAEDVENRHDKLLIEYSKGLPKVTRLIMKHTIQEGDHFQMVPNYKNFQAVRKGEVLAYDKNGPIKAEEDGHILMPLYQMQGDDGFFLIKMIEGF
jgi:succinylglutamate desuccinylase